jgi:hypothetical protein
MLEKFFPSSLPLQPQDELQQVECNLRGTIFIPRLNVPQLMVALETKIDSDGCSKKAKVRINLFSSSPPRVKYCAACCRFCSGHMPTRERKSEALRAAVAICGAHVMHACTVLARQLCSDAPRFALNRVSLRFSQTPVPLRHTSRRVLQGKPVSPPLLSNCCCCNKCSKHGICMPLWGTSSAGTSFILPPPLSSVTCAAVQWQEYMNSTWRRRRQATRALSKLRFRFVRPAL